MEGIFYIVVRVFLRFDGSESHSTEYFKQEDYASIDELLRATRARYHNIISADLQNKNISYQQCFVMDNGGNFVAGCLPFVDDRRNEAPQPEPEPEQE